MKLQNKVRACYHKTHSRQRKTNVGGCALCSMRVGGWTELQFLFYLDLGVGLDDVAHLDIVEVDK